jgi:hypothetical protein
MVHCIIGTVTKITGAIGLGQEHYILSKGPSLPALAVPSIESELRELHLVLAQLLKERE